MTRTIIQLSKAQIASVIATAIDYLVTAMLFQFIGLGYAVSTLCGALTGGMLNCTVNYLWTFPHCGCAVRYIMVKYLLVWMISMTLNTNGTAWLATTLEANGMNGGLGTLMAARITISVIVALAWNFPAYKKFVYHNLVIKRP